MDRTSSKSYLRIEGLLVCRQCVILDGGVTVEFESLGMKDHHISDQSFWGT